MYHWYIFYRTELLKRISMTPYMATNNYLKYHRQFAYSRYYELMCISIFFITFICSDQYIVWSHWEHNSGYDFNISLFISITFSYTRISFSFYTSLFSSPSFIRFSKKETRIVENIKQYLSKPITIPNLQ